MVFEKYAQYYDLLYQEKDYHSESDYVISLINKFQKETQNILEFGSGSGIHGRLLGNKGFKVSGIEKSQDMIDLGRLSLTSNEQGENFSCTQGDCTNTFIGDDFDAIISLFHVLSYQTTNETVNEMLKNANRQLKQGGIFVLDYWYAPAVWNICPSLRVKRVNDEEVAITRIAEPECLKEQNKIKVHYQTFVEDLKTKNISKIEETHVMRAFEKEEIKEFCNETGFILLHSEEWLSSLPPSNETWGVCSILQKK
jgi:SAM-dependent methyltransferase